MSLGLHIIIIFDLSLSFSKLTVECSKTLDLLFYLPKFLHKLGSLNLPSLKTPSIYFIHVPRDPSYDFLSIWSHSSGFKHFILFILFISVVLLILNLASPSFLPSMLTLCSLICYQLFHYFLPLSGSYSSSHHHQNMSC